MALPKLVILAMAAGAAALTRRGAVGHAAPALRGGSKTGEEIMAEALRGESQSGSTTGEEIMLEALRGGSTTGEEITTEEVAEVHTYAALALRGGFLRRPRRRRLLRDKGKQPEAAESGGFIREPSGTKITEEEVREAQEAWGKAVVAVGKVYSDGGDYKAVGKAGLDVLYGYHSGFDVLFKPTKARDFAVRTTEAEAVSYFVGADAVDSSHSGARAEDKGFALAPFTHVRWNNYGTIIDSESATAMGEYYFTGTDGSETKVEYTFQYRRAADGSLKIVVHHSSVPFAA